MRLLILLASAALLGDWLLSRVDICAAIGQHDARWSDCGTVRECQRRGCRAVWMAATADAPLVNVEIGWTTTTELTW